MSKIFKGTILLGAFSMTVSIANAKETQAHLDDALNQATAEPVVLATIQFSNGNVINYLEYDELNELMVEEITHAGEGEVLILQQLKGGLLDKYLQVTPEGTPIPWRLLDYARLEVDDSIESDEPINDVVVKLSESDDVLAAKEPSALNAYWEKAGSRPWVLALDTPIFMDLETSGLSQSLDLKAAGTGSCNTSTGYLHFENLHCNVSGDKGRGGSNSYCDRGMHAPQIQRTSSSKMRTTFSIAANCGTGDGAIVHSKKSGGFYNHIGTRYLGDDQVGSYESWAGKYSIRKYRRVNIWKVTEGGYVRGWTRFNKDVK